MAERESILVPIHVEALVVPPKTPHLYNPATDVLPPVTEKDDPILKTGIHLHWFLPAALTRGAVGDKGTVFPTAPNRWLVTRDNGIGGLRHWVVESDYIHPTGQGANAVAFYPGTETGPLFWRIGRVLPISPVWPLQPGPYRFDVTAQGYGVPTFAAYYPQCRTVFGFHDAGITSWLTYEQGRGQKVWPENIQRYSVIGWYSDPKKDILAQRFQAMKTAHQANNPAEKKSDAELVKEALEDLEWQMAGKDLAGLPERTFFGGVVTEPIPEFNPDAEQVAVGNDLGEALAAFLARELPVELGDKADIESQLAFLSMRARLVTASVDREAAFDRGEHEKGFNALHGGIEWVLVKGPAPAPAPQGTAEPLKVELPPELAQQLDKLNEQQRALDQVDREIADLRERDAQARHTEMRKKSRQAASEGNGKITTEFAGPLGDKLKTLGLLKANRDIAQGQVKATLTAHNQTPGAEPHELKEAPAPRFWQAREPVALIPRVGLPPFLRNQEMPLRCEILGLAVEADLLRWDQKVKFSATPRHEPWPVFLDWKVAFTPVAAAPASLEAAQAAGRYGADFVTKNFTLRAGGVDLQPAKAPAVSAATRSANAPGASAAPAARQDDRTRLCAGSSVLTAHAARGLREQIASYLDALRKKTAGPDSAAALDPEVAAFGALLRKLLADPQAEMTLPKWMEWLDEHASDLLGELKPTGQAGRALETFLKAFVKVRDEGYMGQAFSGFHDLLLGREVRPLSSADPLGLADPAPEPGAPPEPNPLRAGVLELRELTLVDSFGRRRALPLKSVIVSNNLSPAPPLGVTLPLRLALPARLNFRWQSAAEEGPAEMTAHPATQPVCGWLLPDFADKSAMVYGADGKAVGRLSSAEDRVWEAFRAAGNGRLQQVIDSIANAPRPREVVGELLTAAQNALRNIVPDHTGAPVTVAQLISRPLALVLASLSLEVYGGPAAARERAARRFDDVRFMVRLGEQEQLNDGVIGFWLEKDGGKLDGGFRRPQSALKEDGPDFTLAVDEERRLILLLDPLGKAHATTGIQPVKAIDIPPAQYAEQLKRLEVTFRTAPVLSKEGALSLPFPPDPGAAWTWMRDEQWEAASGPAPDGAFGGEQELREAWVRLVVEQPVDKGMGPGTVRKEG